MVVKEMMMNVIAITFLLGVSMAFAGVWSPLPRGGGQRAELVESGEGNTKVSFSDGIISAAEEQLSAAAAAVAGVAQDAKSEGGRGHGRRPRELVCDSYGKCKHKISGAFTQAKHMFDTWMKVTETAQEVEETAKEAAEAMADKAKETAQDVATYPMWRKLLDSFTGMIHLLGFATAYGMAVWVTFGMSRVLGTTLPREQFAVVQSRVYPLYFKAMASCLALALMGHLLWDRNRHNVSKRLQEYNLAGLIASVLVNLLYLEPRASKAMFERMKIEKEEGRGVTPQANRLTPESETGAMAPPQTAGEDDAHTKIQKLRTRLGKLNSYSSLLNVSTLVGLTWHLFYLSQRLCLKSQTRLT